MDNPQPKVSESERGWVAGFFDGEGTVALSLRPSAAKNGGPKVQPIVKISGTDTESLNALTVIMDTSGIAHHVAWWQPKGFMKTGGTYKPAWSITVAGHRRCKRFCQWLTPYLVTKRERAELLLDYIAAREGHIDPRTPITEREWSMAQVMRSLNKKGGKAQSFTGAVTLNAERPGASSEQLAINGRKGSDARWGIRD